MIRGELNQIASKLRTAMSYRNEYRHGYKKSKAGWIPLDWDCTPLAKVAFVQTGLAKNKQNNLKDPVTLPYLRVANVQDGFLWLQEIKTVEIESTDVERYLLKYGDVLFTEGGDFDKLGRGTIWRNEISQCLHQNHVFAVRCKRTHLSKEFLALIAASSYGRRYFILNSKQSTNLASINSSQLKEFPLPLPRLQEQEKIAEILSTWDNAINQTRKLIAAKKNHKKALVQQLFETRKRAKEGQDTLPLSALISPVSRPVPKPNEPYLAIGLRSHGKGTFHRTIEAPEKVEMDTLFRVEKNDIFVNITFAWEGAIAVASEKDAGGLVSHRFPTFKAKKNADLSFVRQLILTRKFVWDLGLISPGGAGRNRVMSKTDFLDIRVFALSKQAQQKIGRILSTADKEIELLEDKLAALEKQKRGLMQKLLTGEVRVKV